MAARKEEYVFDSWEDLENSEEFDRRLNSLKVTQDKSQECRVPDVVPTVQDLSRSHYAPQVKILKRQADSTANAGPTRTNASTRTLKEREADYAEARMRILGQGTAPDDSDARPPQLSRHVDGPRRVDVDVTSPQASGILVRQPRGPDGSRGFNERR